MAFSPDSKTLAAGGRDGKGLEQDIVLWDVATGKQSGALKGHRSVTAVAFSPDGKLLASGGEGIHLWNLSTSKSIASNKGHRGLVHTVTFSPNGKLLASGAGWDSQSSDTVGLWEVETLKPIDTVPQHTESATTMSFSPNGKILAFAGRGRGKVRMWEVEIGRDRTVIDLEHGQEEPKVVIIHCIAFSPDGKTLALAHQYPGIKSPAPVSDLINVRVGPDLDPGDVTLWDTTTGKLVDQLKGHKRFASVTFVAFSPDGKLLASASSSSDRTIRLWDVQSKKTVASLEIKTPDPLVSEPWANRLAFSPDGKILAVASRLGNVINLWSLERGK